MRHFVVVALLLLPLVGGAGFVHPAQAASGCEGEISTTKWNTTVQRHALVPFDNNGGWMWAEDPMLTEDEAIENDDKFGGRGGWDDALHPEESWMYTRTWPEPLLTQLNTNHYITMEIGNDSVGALRFNLSSQHRTTFCVTLLTIENNVSTPVDADVYLMTSSQYSRYEEVYRAIHGGWYWWDEGFSDGDSTLSDIPPEWRSFDITGWSPYRDVHQYENRDQVTFSVALDGPETYRSWIGEDEWENFYLVVDAWDNAHDNDAGVVNGVVVADVTVITEERTIVLPPWTVPLLVGGLMVGAVLMPVVFNKRYMAAGLGTVSEVQSSVPLLEQASDG